MAAMKKGGLGRGLDALFADAVPVSKQDNKEDEKQKDKTEHADIKPSEDTVCYIKLFDIAPNTNQPRKYFNEEKIDDLAKSIKEHGIIQPIVVRKKSEGYEIVAGERRWRAAIKAELTAVPCIIRNLDDEQNMLFAIIENMQREDLNPIEEAEGLNQMVVCFGMTQEEISKGVGKSRPYITNSLRLLKLPDMIKEKISDGGLSAAHGRSLASIEDEKQQRQLCDRIIKEGLSVRETEKIVSQLNRPKRRSVKRTKNPNVTKVESELKDIFGTKVSINQTGKKGKIEIEFFSREELDRLIELLKTLV